MELSLDLSLVYVPKTISEYLKEVSKVKDCSLKLSKIEEYLSQLEQEMKKIEAFQRELPLCMLLLNDAIVKLREETMQYQKMEEIVSEKENSCRNGDREMENDLIDKKNWMSSVQLWIDGDSKNQDSKSETKQRSEEDDDRSTCENPVQLCNYRSKEEEFVAFKAKSGIENTKKIEEKEVVSQVTGLSLITPVSKLSSCNLMPKISGSNQIKTQNKPQQQQKQQQQQSVNKKRRRCWSPELHRRFVDALQQLGGSQVATPKQIKELMQVDGLTNDEVKSHLQKYRLHIRKHPASSGAQASFLWMTRNENGDHPSKQSVMNSNSPEGSFHQCGTAKGMSNTGDENMEAEDDNSSASNSWK
ncbi:transcription factor HHO5 [Mercurialis annua]|uniref:transcription factor HHO5 n=1 Tax=Mercurialis annua TaxID=3986 RepID=UPI00215E8E69|nr:transcription factor HHO5 [Mercurialis annua]